MLNIRSSTKAALIVAVTVIAYLPALRNGFVWDDDAWLMNNPTLHGLKGLCDLWFNVTALQQYFPITGTVFWAEYQLWGFHPLGYHVVNLLLHATNAVLFGLALQKLGLRGAWFAAAVFAVHPVMVESVAWITEIKNTLSTAFYLLSALAYLQFDDLSKDLRPRNWKWFVVSLMLFVCALLTKTITCSLPIALAILIWWKRGRLRLADVCPLLVLVSLAVPMALLTAWLELHHVGAMGPQWDLTFSQRCAVAGRAIVFYICKLIWPAKLTFIYPRWNFTSRSLLIFPFLVVGGVITLWQLRQRIGKGPLAAVLFFIVALGPILGFANGYAFQFSFVADHWQYLASFGIFSMLSALPWVLPPGARQIVPAVVIVSLGSLTWRQCYIYKNIETIWRDTLGKNSNCWIAHNNLAVDLRDHRRFIEAASHFKEAIRIKPDHFQAEDGLGEVFLAEGQLEQAAAHVNRSLEINPRYVDAIWDKALILARQGQRETADAIVKQGLQQDHVYLKGLNNYAWLLATATNNEIRDPRRAQELARRCCELSDYSNPDFLDTLAAACAAEGRFEEAIRVAGLALDLAANSGKEMIGSEIEIRLELYKRGLPYEEP